MKILLTGGVGFIVSHIADLLIEDGHQLIIFDNLSTGKEANLNSAASFYHSDILDEGLEEIFSREKPDIEQPGNPNISLAVLFSLILSAVHQHKNPVAAK